MAENQEPKRSNKDRYLERLKSRYPDREYADDEALFGQTEEDYNNYENVLNGYREREGVFTNLLNEHPRAAQFITDINNGKDPVDAIIEWIGSDRLIDLINDPDKKLEYEEANKKYEKRLKYERELEAEFNKNLEESIKLCDQYEAQYGKEKVDKVIKVIDKIRDDANMGKVTKETFDMAMKVVNHDADMETARAEGEIAGKNAKIEEKLRKQKSSDGLPMGGGGGQMPAEPKKKGFFDDLPKRKF